MRAATAARLATTADAARRVAAWRAAGDTVACVAGAFDVLHATHVRALADARGSAARLVVIVRGDAEVARRAGAGRPAVGAADRARLVAALAGVDAVVVADDVAAVAAALGVAPVDLDPALAPLEHARLAALRARGPA